MRCRCCDTEVNVKATLGDYYCSSCSRSVSETILDDQIVYDLTRFEDYGRKHYLGQKEAEGEGKEKE